MMIVKLAKPVMENEEGMNHLWIQFQCPPSANITDVQIALRLPEGILRLKNLNGYPENEFGVIQMNNPVNGRDVIIEIYTQDTVNYDKAEISLHVDYRDNKNQEQKDIHSIPIIILGDDELDDLIIDEEVVNRVKTLRDPFKNHENDDECEFVVIPPNIVINQSNEFSGLEKKYRIDY